ncbi:hypothetical protein BO94DRAFT_533051 [Aspergillus sclerotioniger CBS 115572]|uniref:Uncharacterized protein n=1 Tax=Aspergillus sclerotioniger CBS 115572 TaxID=1450535 RepID=A0A317X6N5_9EURO|nr:hypothetical protein BO94DRAFT_533051 [Aspergillus sclerotioniger CBS 115572]PWY93312.1 hypothetical protein BO94DRAFT_533051 [Aspergillus sclerotioniger CBS 115572]
MVCVSNVSTVRQFRPAFPGDYSPVSLTNNTNRHLAAGRAAWTGSGSGLTCFYAPVEEGMTAAARCGGCPVSSLWIAWPAESIATGVKSSHATTAYQCEPAEARARFFLDATGLITFPPVWNPPQPPFCDQSPRAVPEMLGAKTTNRDPSGDDRTYSLCRWTEESVLTYMRIYMQLLETMMKISVICNSSLQTSPCCCYLRSMFRCDRFEVCDLGVEVGDGLTFRFSFS